MKLPKEDIFVKVKAYVGTVKPMLLQQIRFHLYLAHGSKVSDDRTYSNHWKDNSSYEGIVFLIKALEMDRSSNEEFAADVLNNKQLFKDSLYALLELLNVSVKHTEQYDIQGLNLLFAFHKDLEKLINHVLVHKTVS